MVNQQMRKIRVQKVHLILFRIRRMQGIHSWSGRMDIDHLRNVRIRGTRWRNRCLSRLLQIRGETMQILVLGDSVFFY